MPVVFRTSLLIIWLLAAASGVASAEPVYAVYLAMQNGAPEALNITVKLVEKSSTTRSSGALRGGTVTITSVTMVAAVDEVLRTSSNLTRGSDITIRFQVFKEDPPVPGPHEPVVPESGQKVRAYLEKRMGANNYILAADGESFVKP